MHANEQVLRKVDEAMLANDIEGMFSHYADDVSVHITGGSKLAGDYKGIEALQELFGRFMEASGEYSFENHAYFADDEHGVILQKGTMSKAGKTQTLDEVFVFHFRKGKISEMWYLTTDVAALDAWIG